MLTKLNTSWRSILNVCACSCASANRLFASVASDNTNRLDDGGASALSPTFLENTHSMEGLVSHLRSLVNQAIFGGGQTAIDRHKGRGKLLPRERIAALLDPGSPFLELSQLAGHQLYGKTADIMCTNQAHSLHDTCNIAHQSRCALCQFQVRKKSPREAL